MDQRWWGLSDKWTTRVETHARVQAFDTWQITSLQQVRPGLMFQRYHERRFYFPGHWDGSYKSISIIVLKMWEGTSILNSTSLEKKYKIVMPFYGQIYLNLCHIQVTIYLPCSNHKVQNGLSEHVSEEYLRQVHGCHQIGNLSLGPLAWTLKSQSTNNQGHQIIKAPIIRLQCHARDASSEREAIEP